MAQTTKTIWFILLFGFSCLGLAADKDQAELIMQILPDEVPTGKSFAIVIQFKNTGDFSWESKEYSLSAKHSYPFAKEIIKLKPGSRIISGETATFKFNAVAPLTPGEYSLQWQLNKGKKSIGRPTPPVMIRVTGNLIPRNNAEFVFQNVPARMLAGQTYTVSLQFKNTGETTWVAGQHALSLTNKNNALTWAIERIDLPPGTIIKPGDFHSFRFNVRAPSDPALYSFQWQLFQNQSGLFGIASDELEIEIQASP